MYYDNPLHPNYERWKRSKKLSFEKGLFVKSIIEKYKILRNINIIDIGSGYGGTLSNFMEERNKLFSIDFNIERLKLQKFFLKSVPFLGQINFICANVNELPLKNISFDIVILQDSLEHFDSPIDVLKNINEILKSDGLIYLSTPNRNSIFNLISDPHWGFPFVSLLSREQIKNYFIPIFRRGEINRKGIAELMSLNKIISIIKSFELKASLKTTDAVDVLSKNPNYILWSNFHLSLIKLVKALKLDKFLKRLANDRIGIINKFFTPTFYFIIQRNNSKN